MKKFMLTFAAALSGYAYAHTEQATPATTLEQCVIQEVIQGKNMTGAFLNINHKGADIEITGVKIPSITDHVELHQMVMKGDVMEMAPLENKKISEGVREFRKGADHLMLMQIDEAKLPKVGEKHIITVEFSDGTSASCDGEVKTVEDVMALFKKDNGHVHSH